MLNKDGISFSQEYGATSSMGARNITIEQGTSKAVLGISEERDSVGLGLYTRSSRAELEAQHNDGFLELANDKPAPMWIRLTSMRGDIIGTAPRYN
jgi:hypothetical protein